MSELIRLDRMGSTPWGTLGTLRLPDGSAFPTVEPQWRGNISNVSCIPAGEYVMSMRSSPIVAKTSGFEFIRGWEIEGVPGRDLIMIHPGNWERNTEGCVLVGRAHAVIQGTPGISSSRAAFKDLMGRLSKRTDWRIAIAWLVPQ